LKNTTSTPLSDMAIHVKLKLSALWATTVLCYIYGDLFGFFKQQTLTEIVSGKAGPIGTQAGLLAAALSVVIPSVMVTLSLVAKPRISRWLNMVLGIAYTIIMLLTLQGAWMYYMFLGAIEVVLTLLIVWYAWHWPKQESQRPDFGQSQTCARCCCRAHPSTGSG
jgi:hypothetical protein